MKQYLYGALGLSAIILSACGNNTNTNQHTPTPGIINTGDTVNVTYTLSWSDGNVFASNNPDTGIIEKLITPSLKRKIAASFEAGDSNIPRGSAVINASKGDTLSGTITPQSSSSESYYDVRKIQKVSRSSLADTFIPTKGDIYDIGGKQGYIINIAGQGSDQEITFDLNPRETWDAYEYTITIDNVVPTTTP